MSDKTRSRVVWSIPKLSADTLTHLTRAAGGAVKINGTLFLILECKTTYAIFGNMATIYRREDYNGI